MSVTYTYSDGSGNTYIIQNEPSKIIEYNPVKPRYSSSGVYDGGAPTMKKISSDQYKQITSILNDAIDNKESHIENRIKTSGMITKKEYEREQIIFLSNTSKELVEIETLLKKLIKN